MHIQVDLKDDKLFGYELSDIQYKILEILHEVDTICKKNQSLSNGTLSIGATSI